MTTAVELVAAYREGELSPVEETRRVLARAQALNPRLNAFYVIDEEGALQAAAASEARWRQGRPLSRLDGVPLSIKDHLQVRGMTTPRGAAGNHAPASFDCPAAARLREAGAVILGKTTMPELSVIPVTESAAFGITRNPWSLDYSPGGSSGGAAAAVAAGLGALAVGSDGGGSIRLPASFTNLVGLKPTLGRVPYWPGQTDRTAAGPMTRTVEDAALMLGVLAQADGRDWTELGTPPPDYTATLRDGVRGLRIGYGADFGYQKVDPEVAALCQAAARHLEAAGAHLGAVEQVGFDPFDTYMTQATLRFADAKPTPGLPPVVASVYAYAAALTPRDIQAMYDRRNALGDALGALFATWDLVVSPAAPFPAPRVATLYPDGDIRSATNRQLIGFAAPFNLVHMPAISVPAGFTASGLPVGLQIAGPKLSEPLLLRAAQVVEDAIQAYRRRPALAPPAP